MTEDELAEALGKALADTHIKTIDLFMSDITEDEKTFIRAQHELPEEFAKILHDNYWDLLA